MATAASSYYSEADNQRPLSGETQLDRSGSYVPKGNNDKRHTTGTGVYSEGSSVDYEPANEADEHHVRKGLQPTSEGPPQVHIVRHTSRIPSSETRTGLVGTDGRLLSHELTPPAGQHQPDHSLQQSNEHTHGNTASNHESGEQYTARDEGLEPYSAPPQDFSSSGQHPASSGYLPDKKVGVPAAAATATGASLDHGHDHENTSYGNTGEETRDRSGAGGANDRERALLADPAHPDNTLVEELERRAREKGTHATGFGTHGDEDPAALNNGLGESNKLSGNHLANNDFNNNNNNNTHGDNDEHRNYAGVGAGGLAGGALGAGAYSRGHGDDGDHTDNEAPDMQPSQSYIQRQSLYSQPPSTRGIGGENGELPLTQQKTGQSYREQPYQNNDYDNQHRLVPAGGDNLQPVAGVLPEDSRTGALAGHNKNTGYTTSSYTQAGMAGVGAGTLAGAGAAAVGTGHQDTARYAPDQQSYQDQREAYEQQQMDQYGRSQQQPEAEAMAAYPSHQTQGTQRTVQTQPSFATRATEKQQQQRDMPFDRQQQQGNAAIVPHSQFVEDQQHQEPRQATQSEFGELQNQSHNQQAQQIPQDQVNGPHTGVTALNATPSTRNSILTSTTSPHPIAGGGLAAAITTSGHDLTKVDKKGLKKEIKSERKFEKSLQEQAKKEAEEIEMAMKMAKLSMKKADKSGRYEANFRSTYEKAIKKEVAAKQRLLRVTNEYNKVAADLERVAKEMEIRRNLHIADVQTRDSDANKVDELRRTKGQHDMEREARHGDSLIKQKQAKRALSMSSKRKSSLF